MSSRLITITSNISYRIENLNFDFVDILIRQKLKVGNEKEILIKINE